MSINTIVAISFIGFFLLSFIGLLLSLTIGLPLVATAFTRDSILDIAPYRTYSNIPKPKKYKDLSNPQDYKKSSDNLKYFIVHGDSVSCFKIFNKNRLLVEKYNSIKKDNIKGRPIVIIQNHHGLFLSKYKITKFIDYVDFLDIVSWDDIYDRNSNFLEKVIDKSYFKLECRRVVRGIKKNNDKQYILSVSLDESNELMVHLDLINNIYGRVVKVVDDSTDF